MISYYKSNTLNSNADLKREMKHASIKAKIKLPFLMDETSSATTGHYSTFSPLSPQSPAILAYWDMEQSLYLQKMDTDSQLIV